jgi:hypothetical protein
MTEFGAVPERHFRMPKLPENYLIALGASVAPGQFPIGRRTGYQV